MNKNLTIGVIIVIALAGGYWYFNQPSSAPVAQQTTQVAAEQTAQKNQPIDTAAAPTNNAPITKTYVDPKYGFSFVYPSSMQVETSGYMSRKFRDRYSPVVFINLRNDAQQTEGYFTVVVEHELIDSSEGASIVQINGKTFTRHENIDGFERDRDYIYYDDVSHRSVAMYLTAFPSACINSGCENRKWSPGTEAALMVLLDAIAQTLKIQ